MMEHEQDGRPGRGAPKGARRWLRTPFWPLLVLPVLLGGGMWVLREPVLFSDAARVRDDPGYERLLAPPDPRIQPASSPEPSGPLSLVRSNDLAWIPLRPAELRGHGETPLEVVRQTDVSLPDPPDGSPPVVRLNYIGVGYGPIPRTRWPLDHVPTDVRYFDAGGRELSIGAEIKALPRAHATLTYRGRFPSVVFGLQLAPGARLLSTEIFDARTHRIVHAGLGRGNMEGTRLEIYAELTQWHAAPLELVLDVLLGPVETEGWNLEPGRAGTFGDWRLAYVGHVEGAIQGVAPRSDALTFRLGPDTLDRESTFLFRVTPNFAGKPMTIALLDAQGKALSRGGGSWGQIGYVRCRVPADQVASIRIRRHTRAQRIVLTLPMLPGLPDENRAVSNLFEVVMPFVRVRNLHDMEQLIEGSVQMNLQKGLVLAPPANYFPRAFTNITPRMLVQEYRNLSTDKPRPRVQASTQTLQWQRNYLDVIRVWLGKVF